MDRRLVSRRALLGSLIGAGAAGVAAAQQGQKPLILQPGPDGIARKPQILSGSDVGFRVEGVGRGGTRVGALVVRVDGEWVEAEMAPTLRRGTVS